MQLRRDERLLNYLYLRLQLYAHYVLMQKKINTYQCWEVQQWLQNVAFCAYEHPPTNSYIANVIFRVQSTWKFSGLTSHSSK